ncbi:MAG TPA: hypothetical protein VF928_11075 [Usitatibacteraceae bacterium]
MASDTNASGALTTTNTYAAAGRMLSQHVVNEANSAGNSDTVFSWYQTKGRWETQSVYNWKLDEWFDRTVWVTHTDVTSGYDAVGNLLNYRVTQGSIVTDTTVAAAVDANHGNALYGGFREGTITSSRKNTTTTNPAIVGVVTSNRDANGYLTSVRNSGAAPSFDDRNFINDVNGKVLQKTQQLYTTVDQPMHTLKQLVVNDNVEGIYGNGTDPNKPGITLLNTKLRAAGTTS